MGKINYKKLEKIAFKSDEFFIERKHHSFCS